MKSSFRTVCRAVCRAVSTTASVLLVTAFTHGAAQAAVSCTDSILTDDPGVNPSFVSCIGSFEGNTANAAISYAGTSYDYIGTTGNSDAGEGPFAAFGADFKTGMLSFDEAWSGSFVLALKAGNRHSLYQFTSASGFSSVHFDTLGVSVNNRGIGLGLAHVSLYGGAPLPVVPSIPEPGTYALMFAGLSVMALVARRRRPV